jgi:hypothetical protein
MDPTTILLVALAAVGYFLFVKKDDGGRRGSGHGQHRAAPPFGGSATTGLSPAPHRVTRPGVQPPLAQDEFAFGHVFGFTPDELRNDGLIGQSVRGFADQLRFGEGRPLSAYTPGAGNQSIPPPNAALTPAETAFAHRVVGLSPAELHTDHRKTLFVRGFADQLLAHYGGGATLAQFGPGAGQTFGGRNDPPTGGKNKGGFNVDLSHVDWGAVAQTAAKVAPVAVALLAGEPSNSTISTMVADALAHETDPTTLRTIAATVASAGFPAAANTLLAKADRLDGSLSRAP